MHSKVLYSLAILVSLLVIAASFTEPSVPARIFKVAAGYQEKGRYLEALSFYRDIFANQWTQGLSALLYKGAGDLYYEYLEDDEKALLFYETLLQKFPRQPFIAVIHHRVAKIFYRQGAREKALDHYRFIFGSFPAYYKENHLHEEIERLEQGEKLLEDIILSVERPFSKYIRILLQDDSGQVVVSAKQGLKILANTDALPMSASAGAKVECRASGDKIYVKNFGFFESPISLKPLGQDCLKINKNAYRGYLLIHLIQGNLLVVNHVKLEEYLYGVVPREISPSWPGSSLKAQAVAARSYALYHMAKREAELYDVFSTTASQVYGGKGSERKSTQRAVDETEGLILSYHKKIALALYHANSGGETEGSAAIWGKYFPYLNGRRDTFSSGLPGFSWDHSLPAEQIQKSLRAFGFPGATVENILPLERSSSGRINKLQITEGPEAFYLSGNSFRLIVGPGKIKSANFQVARKGKNFIFKGQGYGHGVGMSQWGVYQMAKNDYGYEEILQFYYPGTEIVRIDLVKNVLDQAQRDLSNSRLRAGDFELPPAHLQ